MSNQRENSWIFTQEELDNPPSLEYMTLAKEREWRKLANKFVLNVAKAPRLKFSRATISTAQTFIHRYYMRRTFNDNPWDVSIAAIFLASKIVYEYTSRVSRYLIHECARTAKKIADPHFELNRKEKEYGYWKNNMLYYEAEMLRILCYDLNVDEPYSYSSKWCKKYNVPIEEEAVMNYLLNESYIRTVLCLQYSSETIAAGAFFLAVSQNITIDWKRWINDINIPPSDIKDVSLKLKEMLTTVNEKSPTHQPHKYLSHKSFSSQDFVKSPSPLKISSMNNDIDKNSIDNNNNNNLNISKIQLLSSPPKSDNSDLHEKDNQKEFKEIDLNNEIRMELKHTSNENEDWEVVDMDIDDDDDVIPNPNPNTDNIVNTSITNNSNSDIRKDESNIINSNSKENCNNTIIKYDNYKSKNNYLYYSNSRKHYLQPPPPPFHYSRSRSRGSYHYSYSRSYTNNYSNSGSGYYRGSSSSFFRNGSGRGGINNNHKLNNSSNSGKNSDITNSNMNNLSPKGSNRLKNYYPQY